MPAAANVVSCPAGMAIGGILTIIRNNTIYSRGKIKEAWTIFDALTPALLLDVVTKVQPALTPALLLDVVTKVQPALTPALLLDVVTKVQPALTPALLLDVVTKVQPASGK